MGQNELSNRRGKTVRIVITQVGLSCGREIGWQYPHWARRVGIGQPPAGGQISEAGNEQRKSNRSEGQCCG